MDCIVKWRVGGRAALALGVALAAVLLAGSTAGAQTPASVLLVGNTGQSDVSARVMSDAAQAFTTGASADGYLLTSVELSIRQTGSTQPTYSVSIHSSSGGSTGSPDARLGAPLTNPASLPTQANPPRSTFTSSGIRLAANTTYFVVIEVSDGGDAELVFANSDDEDAGGKPGWSIADRSLSRGEDAMWGSGPDSSILSMALRGHDITALIAHDLAAPPVSVVVPHKALPGVSYRITVEPVGSTWQ